MNAMLLKTCWRAISNRHINEDMDKLQAVRVRLMNQYAFLISLIFITDAFRNLCFGRHVNFSILFTVGCALFLLSWYTRVYFSTKIAASTLVGATLMVFYFCSTAGFHNGIAPYYFAILFAALFIFNEKNSLYNIFVFLWIFVLFYIVQLFHLEWFDGVEESQVYLHKNQQTTFVQAVLLLAVNGYFIMQKNKKIQNLYHQALRGGMGLSNDRYSEQPKSATLTSPAYVVKLAKDDDMAFLPMFKQVFPDFYEKLREKNPEMTREEFKFCALLKLGFTTKDIANYNHMAVRSVQTKKSRLRKSFSIPPDEDIYKWIDRF
ncbi:diguanylate cyclase [Sphingobacterium haloxyli]|uniref:Diguanylate cyclase n=2 Tax=Sphingobacterium haloxyli TaxID=2100533 RepID=A0A2S9J608_9SPHI|nr:diguanylate cyclase [Sphingobacterium haloxyli]